MNGTITSITEGITMQIVCPHCDNYLSQQQTLMSFSWSCKTHGEIYIFWACTVAETENSLSLRQK